MVQIIFVMKFFDKGEANFESCFIFRILFDCVFCFEVIIRFSTSINVSN